MLGARDSSNSPRRRFRLTLRTLLLLLTIVSTFLGLLARNFHRALNQRAAINEVRASDGTILYSYQWDPDQPFETDRGAITPGVPDSVVDALGVDFFYSPYFALVIHPDTLVVPELATLRSLCYTPFRPSDSDMEPIGELSQLRYLDIGDASQITARGVSHLSRLHCLEYIVLYNASRLGDDGLDFARSLPRLRYLDVTTWFPDAPLTDDALASLASNERLEVLWLDGHAITGRGLEFIAEDRLKVLGLGNTRVDDRTSDYITRLEHLRVLDVSGSDIGDKGVAKVIARLDVRRLGLRGTKVGAKTLELLAEERALTALDLSNTSIDAEELGLLEQCVRLTALDLTGTSADDQTVKRLCKLPLEELYLDATNITDASIEYLGNMNALRTLVLPSDYDLRSLQRLQTDLRKCTIGRGQTSVRIEIGKGARESY